MRTVDGIISLAGKQDGIHEKSVVSFAFFDGKCRKALEGKEGCYEKTVEKEHGGTAVREYYITGATDWYSEKGKWKGLKSFGLAHKVLKKRDGSREEEYRCYVCSIGEELEEFERAVGRHWGVENKLHWQMEFTFRDDKNTSMARTGEKNL